MNMPLQRATVIADASYCHNTKVAGYGTWVVLDGGTRLKKSGVIKGSPQNSGEAELKAVMIGIWLAYQSGARNMLIQTDCMAVIQIVRGDVHSGQSGLRAMFNAAKKEHFSGATFRAKHVKGHTNVQDARSFVNRWCDQHAGVAMREHRAKHHGVGMSTGKKKREKRAKSATDAYLEEKYKTSLKRKAPTSEKFKAAMLALTPTDQGHHVRDGHNPKVTENG